MKPKKVMVHVSLVGQITMCGLGPGAPVRPSQKPLKKTEKWCPRCTAMVLVEKAKREAELRRQLELS